MVNQCLVILASAFHACIGWFDAIISRLEAGPVILAGLISVFAIGILLEPLRGGMDLSMDTYTKNTTHKSRSSYKTPPPKANVAYKSKPYKNSSYKSKSTKKGKVLYLAS